MPTSIGEMLTCPPPSAGKLSTSAARPATRMAGSGLFDEHLEYFSKDRRKLVEAFERALLRHMLAFPQFKTYVPEDIADTNAPALGPYEKLGFREFKREKVRHTKRTGINAYVSMRLTQA
ncbi:hypothetical protein AB0L13_42435 [Saccharopolyspora shandongensis]|uniref:hypothetical protein n=1 Tax=Saccharopolyspora shandongensis TaxID=418495 RepID=UPI003446FDF8